VRCFPEVGEAVCRFVVGDGNGIVIAVDFIESANSESVVGVVVAVGELIE
jgi:hypothetical protein